MPSNNAGQKQETIMANFQTLEYKEGQQAYREGLSRDTNPYKDDADKFDDWADGWFEEADCDE
jgi:ribosome modulation factor